MKRRLAFLLAALLTISSLPAAALAAETVDRDALGAIVTEDETYIEEAEAAEVDAEIENEETAPEEVVSEETGSEEIASEETDAEEIDAEEADSEETASEDPEENGAEAEDVDAEAADEGMTDADETASEDPEDAIEEDTAEALDAGEILGEIGVIEELAGQEAASKAMDEAVKSGWKKEDGHWYYYENGKKKTGFITYGGHRFYLMDSKYVG